jgi:hypothetical protein
VSVEILKPEMEGFLGYSFISSALFLSYRMPISENILFISEFPFAYAHVEYSDFPYFEFEETDTKIGNPYLGIELQNMGNSFFSELGIRIPFISQDNFATLVGYSSDFDREEAFLSDIVLIEGMVNYHKIFPSNLLIRIRVGPAFWINIDSNSYRDESELILKYSIQEGYVSEKFSIVAGLTGMMLTTEGDLDIGERTFHQVGMSTNFGIGKIYPGIQFRLPLEDTVTDFVIGLHLTVGLE